MIQLFQTNTLVQQIFLASILFITYIFIKRLGKKWIHRHAKSKEVSFERVQFIIKSFNAVTFLLFIAFFTIILDLGFGDISLFLSSIFAVLGVALFAQWSILSNVTASVLIFFVFPYRMGDLVKITEKDEDISGTIIDITMFHVILRHESGNIITYPNNLILQKGVIKIINKNNVKIT